MKAKDVQIYNYTGRDTESYALNFGEVKLFFSYSTIIAFYHDGTLYISENLWGPTTGRHLNELTTWDNHDVRLPREKFEEELDKLEITVTGG